MGLDEVLIHFVHFTFHKYSYDPPLICGALLPENQCCYLQRDKDIVRSLNEILIVLVLMLFNILVDYLRPQQTLGSTLVTH